MTNKDNFAIVTIEQEYSKLVDDLIYYIKEALDMNYIQHTDPLAISAAKTVHMLVFISKFIDDAKFINIERMRDYVLRRHSVG